MQLYKRRLVYKYTNIKKNQYFHVYIYIQRDFQSRFFKSNKILKEYLNTCDRQVQCFIIVCTNLANKVTLLFLNIFYQIVKKEHYEIMKLNCKSFFLLNSHFMKGKAQPSNSKLAHLVLLEYFKCKTHINSFSSYIIFILNLQGSPRLFVSQ